MCGFNCGYDEVNVSYYGKPMVSFNKTQTVRIIKIHHIKIDNYFIDVTVFENGHKLTFAS